MASLTSYFKTIEKAPTEKKSTPTASPKQSAASRKRKSNSTEEEETKEDSTTVTPAAASSSPTSIKNDNEEPSAKKLKGEGLEELIPESWLTVLKPEFSKGYWPSINKFLREQDAKKVKVFPPRGQIFRALDLCPFDQVKVVILGQDPYHDDGQAEGLCFSVPPTEKVPSSLNNIYKELASDLGASKFTKPKHGNLVKWAQQGVLLLNTGLTVQAHQANSHKSIGWFNFTDAIIKAIAKEHKNVVFLLWGAHAQAKSKLIDAGRHHILKTVHPSGLSASKGFFGCKHFSKTNELLVKAGKKPIEWQV